MFFTSTGTSRRNSGEDKLKDKKIIKTYTGSQHYTTALYRADAVKMAAQGYFQTSRIWTPGEWGFGAIL
jgi:hypothetical protein